MRFLGWALVVVAVLVVGGVVVMRMGNTGVMRELREDPTGERAKKVMLLTLPSGKTLPVNYLRDEATVYAGADFPWWRELREGGGRVTLLVQGEELMGHARAVEDDPELRREVFQRLRPTAPSFTGTLVEIQLDGAEFR